VDARMHAESSKAAVARNLDAWLDTGFLPRLFGFLLDEGYDVHVTSDHGNADASGAGRPKDGDIPESRGERSRVYRSAPLLAAARLSSPQSPNLEPPGLPDSFMVLFAPGRSAFVPQGERLVAHGGPSIEELLVPFVKVSRNA
jgi:hypothetical protein